MTTLINREGGVKQPLLIVALAIVAVIAGAILLRPDETTTESEQEIKYSSSDEPAFQVKLKKPWSARPLGGLFGLIPSEDLGFDHQSPDAETVLVGPSALELKAKDWHLVVETDGGNKIESSSYLTVTMELGGAVKELRCRPADPAIGTFEITSPEDADYLSGKFHFELPTCERAESGRKVNWPPAPLTLRGSFHRLPITETNGKE